MNTHRFLSSSHAGLPSYPRDNDEEDNDDGQSKKLVLIPINCNKQPAKLRKAPPLSKLHLRSQSFLDIRDHNNSITDEEKENASPPGTPSPSKAFQKMVVARSISNLDTTFHRLSLGTLSNSMPALHGPHPLERSGTDSMTWRNKATNTQKEQEKKNQILNQERARVTAHPENKEPLLSEAILSNTSQPELNCIHPQTVADLVIGKYNHVYDKVIVIDCRFEYEFNGGHIRGAESYPHESFIETAFIKNNTYDGIGDRVCLVFHCEFSSHRGPKSWRKLRSLDRKQNEHCYPNLSYPEMYLLEGGYKHFFESHPDLCEPRGYVEMKDPLYVHELKLGMRGRSKSQCRINLSKSAQLPNPAVQAEIKEEVAEEVMGRRDSQLGRGDSRLARRESQLGRLSTSFSLMEFPSEEGGMELDN